MGTRNTFVTVAIVIVAVVVAWWLVGFLWSAIWTLMRLAVVAAVAVVIFLALRSWLSKGSRT